MDKTRICQQCGGTFHKPLCNSWRVWNQRKFCSVKCMGDAFRGKPLREDWKAKMKGRVPATKGRKSSYSGPAHHNWRGGPIEKTCTHCNGVFTVDPGRKSKAKFCSPRCKVAAQDRGRCAETVKIRASKQYRDWRTAIFKRDDYTCQCCGQRGGYLNADHIKPFALFPELRFDVNNGRTLCRPCHLKTPTHGRRMIYREAEIARAA